MKALKSIFIAAALLICFGATQAKDHNEGSLTKTHAINTYVNAVARGKLGGLNDVLDKSAVFSMLRGNKVLNFDKKQMLDYLRSNNGIEQICTTSTSVVENNPSVMIVKVDMKYANFVKSNYVTIANTGAGWKITSVYSVFS